MRSFIFTSLVIHSLFISLLLGGGFSGSQFKMTPEIIHIDLLSFPDELFFLRPRQESIAGNVEKARLGADTKPAAVKSRIKDETDNFQPPSVQESGTPAEIQTAETAVSDQGRTKSHEEIPTQGSRSLIGSGNFFTPGNAEGPAEKNSFTGSDRDSTNYSRMRTAPNAITLLRIAIDKAKEYPRTAKRRGLEGTVITEFTVNSRGFPENIRIVESSGFLILDQAARETILRAAPLPSLNGVIVIPITFSLQK